MKKFFWLSILGIFLLAGIFVLVKHHQRRVAAERARQEALKPPEEVSVTFIEGWSANQVAAKVDEKFDISAKDFITALAKFDDSSFDIISQRPKSASLEGYLFPDTYRFFKEATSEAIIDKLLQNFEDKFSQATRGSVQAGSHYIIPSYEKLTLDDAPGLTAYEVVILASIVERETGRNATSKEAQAALAEERKIIAGIFYNRLQIGKALESDATINYVTGKNDPSASAEDLQVDSPYNTYRHAGLPPGPIANPSLSSIMAVLHPTDTDYFYFLHKQPSGEPVYSKSFEEHKANKQKYL